MHQQQRWYYKLLTEVFGPVSVAQLHEMVAAGTLSASDPVRSENSETWITIEQLLVQDSDIVHGHAGPHTADADAVQPLRHPISGEPAGVSPQEPDIDSFNLQGDSDGDDDNTPVAEFGIDSFRVEGDTDSELPAKPESAELATVYYAESLGETFGPMSFAALLQMAESGALTETDRIRPGDDGEWHSPLSVSELAAAILKVVRSTQDETPKPGAIAARPPHADSSRRAEEGASNDSRSTQKSRRGHRMASAKAGKRKKRARKKDEFLEDIFSEVFTEDGRRREPAPSADSRSSAEAVPSPVGNHDTGREHSPDNGRTGQHVDEGPVGEPMSSVAATPAVSPSPYGQQPSVGSPVPPPPPRSLYGSGAASSRRPQATKSAGFRFSMPSLPEPKIMAGMVSVVLGAWLLVSGVITWPDGEPEVRPFVDAMLQEYEHLAMAGDISAAKWAEFASQVADGARPINEYYGPRLGLTDEQNYKWTAVTKLQDLSREDVTDKLRHQELLVELLELQRLISEFGSGD